SPPVGPTPVRSRRLEVRHLKPGFGPRPSIEDDAPDAFALVHEFEALVDVIEGHCVGDHWIDLDLAVHVPVDDLRHIGATARATECGAHPGPPGDELEGPCRDLLAGAGNPDDHRLAPTA